MDIKTLLHNLHEEVSCSVCMCSFTTPKQLPCLHSFCLHCLNGIQRTSGIHGKITCPECRKQFDIPESGNPSEFPTNFRINRLLDVLAIKECNTAGVKCGNCDKRSAETLYCFQCCSFWCAECISAHNIIRANKQHKTLALKDFQDQDIEAVLKRPAFCQTKNHENKELEFFCKVCQVAICNACAVTEHEGHAKVILETATNEKKLQIVSRIKSLKDIEQEKRNQVEKIKQDSIEVQVQMADVKGKVQTSAEQLIAIIEAEKQDIFNAVDKQAHDSLKGLTLKKDQIEDELKKIQSAIKRTETLLEQSSSAEILGLSKTLDTLLQDHGVKVNYDSKSIPRFSYIDNVELINLLKAEGIGYVKTVFTETKAQPAKCFRPLLSFGGFAMCVGKLQTPWGVAVNDRDEIAVTEHNNSRVSVFSSDGTHLRSFGSKGSENGEFSCPRGIAFDKHGNIIVADTGNHRIQLFSGNGKFLSKFGKEGSLDHQLNCPHGLSITRHGDIIVVDRSNKLIKIFSSSGECLHKFGGEGSLVDPLHCIQQGEYFIVSDFEDQCIKMFDREGNFAFKFGMKGNKDEQFKKPAFLSVNKEGLLMVCDYFNHRVQVFDLNGKFITKFGSEGSRAGEFRTPVAIASLCDGRVVVSDSRNHRIQVFDQM
ncbi:hypothetical protein ABFA07_019232 [Porites harrisoni]